MLRLAAVFVLLLLASRVHAANPVGMCPTAKTGDHAPSCSVATTCAVPTQATDMVRTIVPAVGQVWEPYATLTLGSAVTPCSGGWSTLAAQGIPLFSSLPPPVVTPPPPVVPPPVVIPPTTQTVTVSTADSPAVAAIFSGLPNPQCFTLTNGAQSVTACIPAKVP